MALRENSGSEMAALMRSGASRERSVIKLTQNSKLLAVKQRRHVVHGPRCTSGGTCGLGRLPTEWVGTSAMTPQQCVLG